MSRKLKLNPEVIASVFWDTHDILSTFLTEVNPSIVNITWCYMIDSSLNRSKEKTFLNAKEKSSVSPRQAPCYKSKKMMVKLNELCSESLHHPMYSPDLTHVTPNCLQTSKECSRERDWLQ